MMLITQLKIAWRNLINNTGYSLMNIIGLAMGITVSMLITLWVNDELEYNTNFKNYDRIAQIYQSQNLSDKRVTQPAIPIPLGKVLRENYGSYFKHVVLSSWTDTSVLKFGDKSIKIEGNAMQSDAPKMLNLKMIAGEQQGLNDINSIMLSASAAKKIFGTENPIGKHIHFDFQTDMKITGVYQDFPYQSSFYDVNWFIPWDYYISQHKWVKNSENEWTNNSWQLFVQISENTSFEAVENAIRTAKKERTDLGQINPELHVHPMRKWKLYDNFENGKLAGGRIEYVFLFATIGLVVLLIACINFMNIATARSEKRAKEVGVKKTLGALRSHLIYQFYSESLVVTILAFIGAIVLTYLFLSPFNELTNKQMIVPWSNKTFWTISFLILVLTVLLSGSYPALYLSKFNPVQVLKGTFVKSKFSGILRKSLVVFQFVLSITLIITTIVINRQMHYLKNQSRGYDISALIEIYTGYKPFIGKYELIRNKLLQTGAIINISASSSPVTRIKSNRSSFTWEGRPDNFIDDFAWVNVSYDYVSTLKMNVIAGRDFSRKFVSDSNAILINKAAQKYMGLKDPIDKLVKNKNDPDYAELRIIGVVEDVLMGNPSSPIKQTIFSINGDKQDGVHFYQMKLNPNNSIKTNLILIEKAWKEIAPDFPFDYDFIEQNYANKFKDNDRMITMISIFTGLAIFISCLGLFGLTSFIAEQRTKEIGIRKSVGASVYKIWELLSKDFLVLVILASVIATPLAFVITIRWLSLYKIRVNISYWYFITGIVIAFILAIITVSYHSIKAARANPIKSLKTE